MHLFQTVWLSLSLSLTTLAIGLDYGALPQAVSIALQPGFKDYIGGQEPIVSSSGPATREGTIYQILSTDSRFSRMTKALNFVEDVGALLNESDSQLTFFAPPDEVLRPPRPPKRHCQTLTQQSKAKWSNIDNAFIPYDSDVDVAYFLGSADLVDALELLDEVDATDIDDGDNEKGRRKKILKVIIRAILQYHILPSAYDIKELSHNTTYPTKLTISDALDGKPLRIRFAQSFLPLAYTVNFYTRVVHPDHRARNGFIHVVNHPLLPPPSVFQELYMAPLFFSTLTSVIQRSDLVADTDLRYVHGEGLRGASLVTVFAPTNRAFQRLPKKLQLFLFSPFGERILKKIVQFHIVPNEVVHTNYVHHENVDKSCVYYPPEFSLESDPAAESTTMVDWIKGIIFARRGKHLPHRKPIVSKNLKLDTLYTNHTVDAHIEQSKIKAPFPGHKDTYIIDSKITVNHRPTVVADIVALNGAVHVVDKLLDPRPCKCNHDGEPNHKHKKEHHHKHHHKKCHKNHHKLDKTQDENDGPWSDWENWLVQWADEIN